MFWVSITHMATPRFTGRLVRLAQDWNMRYTLVDGQGNFGSVDGDSAAAMRYTECRLSKLGERIMDDLDKDTVDMDENFDATLQEPQVMPTKIPNLLVNGWKWYRRGYGH